MLYSVRTLVLWSGGLESTSDNPPDGETGCLRDDLYSADDRKA